MKKTILKKIIFIIVFLGFMITDNVFAEQFEAMDYLNNAIESLEISEYDYEINKNISNSNQIDFSFSDIVIKIINGELGEISIFEFIKYIFSTLFEEIFTNSKILKNIIIIALLCAFLNILTESFKNKGVGEIGFYAGYMVIAILIINSFSLAVEILAETIMSISNIINALIPLLAGVLVMSGASGSGAVFAGVIVTFINIVTFIINKIFIPLISYVVILNIVNYITPKEVLNKLIDFLKWIINFGIRATATIFTFVISFQRVTSPMVNSTVNKVAKTAINFIPVVGDVINGTVDSAMYFVGLIKGSIGIAIVICILIVCSIPILKLISFIIIYKVSAILIEPISDKRITACIACIGECVKIVLSALFIFIFLFILLVVVMLSISG